MTFAHLALYTGYSALGGWSGTTGVCFFFVHTSLVLMWSLERDPHTGRFYVRRIFRIYPLWWLVLAITVLLQIPMSPAFAPAFVYAAPTARGIVANILLLFNVFTGANIVGASWTLPIEVEMYLFLPFLFAFARSSRLLWPLLLADAFLMLYNFRTFRHDAATLLFCIPYFLPGIMAFVLFMRPRLRRLPAWSFVPFLLLLALVGNRVGNYTVSWLLALALGCALPLFHDLSWPPLRAACHLVARYSYGIYLTHIVAIDVAVHVLHASPLAIRVATFLLLITVLPVALYHLLEEPLVRFGARVARRIEPGAAPRVSEEALSLEPAP